MSQHAVIKGVIGTAAVVCSVLTLAFKDTCADEWPQWRGPTRDSHIESAPWPETLSGDNLKLLWRVEAGPSYSGPIVTSDRVFITSTEDSKFEVVQALERSSGKKIWEARWEGAMSVPFFARSNGNWIRATPAYDGQRLYVAGMRDVLVCLDAASGQALWRVDFVKELKTPLPAFGFASSPLVMGDYVYVQAGGSFVKLDKKSGKIVWRCLDDGGGMSGSAFSSPATATVRGEAQLLVQTRQNLAGVDPESGEVRWQKEIPAFRGMNILTPTTIGDRVFTSSYGGRAMLLSIDREGNEWKVDQTWDNKVQGYMSSPVVIDGYIYLHLRNQRFTCIEAATGKGCWTTKPFGKYWSLVANGDKMLALDERGELLLIQADPTEFRLLAQHKIGEDTWAHLAVCDDELFVRELNAMSVYRWK